MGKIQNRLSENLASLQNIFDENFWQSSDIEITQGNSSELFEGFSEFKQIELKLAAGNEVGTLFCDDVQMKSGDFDAKIVFLFAVKMPSGGSLTCTISDVDQIGGTATTTSLNLNQSDAVINAPGVLSPQWNIFRSDMFEIPSGPQIPSVNIEILFEPNNPGETFYFTTPAMYPAYEFGNANPAVALIASFLPDVMYQADISADTVPDMPMLRLIDIASQGVGDSLELVSRMSYADEEGGLILTDDLTKSTLVNSSVAELETLIWLCKFTGTQPITRFNFSTEVTNLPFILDSSNLDSDEQIRLTSYLELNPPITDEEAQKTLLRWQLDNGYYGKNAGTLSAVVEAAKLQLINTKAVSAVYDYDDEPYVINIRTNWFETLGAIGPEVIGQSSAIVLESVEPARPLGTKLTHTYVG